MKSLAISLTIGALVFFSLCMGQTPTSELKPLVLQVGASHTFEIYDNGDYVGYNQYTVTDRSLYNEVEAYFITSKTEINNGSTNVLIDASYIVDTYGRSLHYEFQATINGESHVMNADKTEKGIHITGSRPQNSYDKIISAPDDTLWLDNNMIGQWDIMFSAITLEEGGSFTVSALAAQPMSQGVVRASIEEGMVSVEVADTTWECYKVIFSLPEGYTAYVTTDGQLLKLEDGKGVVVVFKE
ncbi:MAG: hypothetical protein PVF58_13500 [Candidatus Methanofastidiosia archaeon]|jgi:hypothetical protein